MVVIWVKENELYNEIDMNRDTYIQTGFAVELNVEYRTTITKKPSKTVVSDSEQL